MSDDQQGGTRLIIAIALAVIVMSLVYMLLDGPREPSKIEPLATPASELPRKVK